MLARLKLLWVTMRDSLWFLPATFTIGAAALALTLVEIERRTGDLFGDSRHWLWGGGVEGARGVLSAIAGGLITVTGVVFSVTIVALQLASSQFTPRLLRNFTADRSNQVVLAVLISTFTYSLLVLRAVQGQEGDAPPFVPRIAATLAVVFVLVSIGFLIHFIDHASKSIQLAVILDRVTRMTKEQIDEHLPELREEEEADAGRWEEPDGRSRKVLAAKSGYVQAVDEKSLVELCQECRIWVQMDPHIGQFILEGRPLATAWPARAIDEETDKKIRKAFILGQAATPDQDLEFGLIEISDIAIKALSPSVNDPTTAMRCIDRLGELVADIGRRRHAPPARYEQGEIRFAAKPVDYERVVGLAFDQIRHFGAGNPTIVRKLVDLLTQMMAVVPRERHPALQAQLEAVVADARRSIESPVELAAFERMLGRHGISS